MLHGAGGRYTEWAVCGFPQKAAEMMAAGEIEEMVIVMPEGGRGYWANGLTAAGEAWGDYMIQDVVPLFDNQYRTTPHGSLRAIGGLSRGGFGALSLAFIRPDIFGIVGAHSPALPTAAELEDGLVSSEAFLAYDPIVLATHLDASSAPRIWLDIGDTDDWQPAVFMLKRGALEAGIPVAFSVGEGGHLQEYWISRTPEYLAFYSDVSVRPMSCYLDCPNSANCSPSTSRAAMRKLSPVSSYFRRRAFAVASIGSVTHRGAPTRRYMPS